MLLKGMKSKWELYGKLARLQPEYNIKIPFLTKANEEQKKPFNYFLVIFEIVRWQ